MAKTDPQQLDFGSEFKKFRLYSTRFQGSKRRVMPWLLDALKDFAKPGNRILDAYAGSGLVSYALASNGYKVFASDQLEASIVSVRALAGASRDLTEIELDSVLKVAESDSAVSDVYTNFQGIFFPDHELAWLDRTATALRKLDKESQSRAFWALFQSSLAKRPYNLFHRSNLDMRTRDVARSFGNKATWEKSFPDHFQKFLHEASTHGLNSSDVETFHGNPLNIQSDDFDIVYLDPPYINSRNQTTPYADYYGFLDILLEPERLNFVDHAKAHKPLKLPASGWANSDEAVETICALISKFQKSTICFSYRSDGKPDSEQLISLFQKFKENVTMYRTPLKYALSDNSTGEEILIVAK
jgi:adenine-specific DNA methylase